MRRNENDVAAGLHERRISAKQGESHLFREIFEDVRRHRRIKPGWSGKFAGATQRLGEGVADSNVTDAGSLTANSR